MSVHNENSLLLRGYAAGEPRPSHTNHGEVYYTFPLSVPRLSGAEDLLNVLAPTGLLAAYPVKGGAPVQVAGQVRSFNNRSGVGSRLVISAFAQSLSPWDEPAPENLLALSGTLCKAPIHRHTPLGREICDLMLAVNRRYGRADYLPCIAWGSLARQCGELEVGDKVRLGGRLQSRTYQKVLPTRTEERTAYEISVMDLEVLPQEAAARG